MNKPATEPYLIGIDVGTTSIKAGLFDAVGNQIAAFNDRYSTSRGQPGEATQNPDDWMRLVEASLNALMSKFGAESAAAVGLTSQVNTHIFVDENLTPLLPAFTWQDLRCADDAALINTMISDHDRMDWWGAPLPVDASHVLARMAYVRRVHPEIWAKTAKVLAPKDYCIAKLTGTILTDPMTAFGVVDRQLALIEPLVALVEGAKSRLPVIAKFTTQVGPICSGSAGAGVPMVVGAMDAWAGFLGAGAAKNGDAVYLSGTSEILGVVSKVIVPTPGVIAFPECENLTIHAGPTQSGAVCLDWAARLFNRPIDELLGMAAGVDVATRVPTFLPHLDGERAPLWDSSSRGAFAGATHTMGPAEFALGVMEGVAYSVRLLSESLQQSAALAPAHFIHAGGGARSDVWCQIRADVLGVPIKRLKNADAGVLGAAMLAGVGTGLFPSIEEAALSLVQTGRVFDPRQHFQKRHEMAFQRYKLLYSELRAFNAV